MSCDQAKFSILLICTALDNEVAMYQSRNDFQNKTIYRQYGGLTTTTHHGLDLNFQLQTLKVHFTSQGNRVSLNPRGGGGWGLGGSYMGYIGMCDPKGFGPEKGMHFRSKTEFVLLSGVAYTEQCSPYGIYVNAISGYSRVLSLT